MPENTLAAPNSSVASAQTDALSRLREVDKELIKELVGMSSIAENLRWKSIGLLSDRDKIADQKYPGLYLIEILTSCTRDERPDSWLAQFKKEWDDENFDGMFTSTTKKRRFAEHEKNGKLLEWMPLYLGKRKNVAARIIEHIDLPLNKKTFALKLLARNLDLNKFRLKTVSLQGIENYDCLAPALEKASRDLIHPIVGKQ